MSKQAKQNGKSKGVKTIRHTVRLPEGVSSQAEVMADEDIQSLNGFFTKLVINEAKRRQAA